MTLKQYQNRIRLIAVAEISKQFRKAGIIEAIRKKVRNSGLVVSGGLANPERSGSLIPTRDDLFLTRRDGKRAVDVKVHNLSQGIPENVSILTNVEFGVSPRYYRLTERSPKGGWKIGREGINNIKQWITRSKVEFTVGGKRLDKSNNTQVTKLAFAIRNKIQRKGLSKRYDFDNPFYYKNRGVKATLEKAQVNINNRLTDLFTEQVMVRFTKLMNK